MKIKFSVLVPLYNTPDDFLRDMIESVQKQSYGDWELCLADASDTEHEYVGKIVAEYAGSDSRIKYMKLKGNNGISENTNACIKMATGNYFVLLDHDDVLDEKALKEVARVIKRKNADFIYTDEAKFTNSVQEWFAPNYKPDFSKYELRAHNYICHLTVYSRELLDRVGLYRKEFDGSQDHDMVLRLTEKAKCIIHISQILYYWRVHSDSVSAGVENKSYAIDAAQRAVAEHVARCGERGHVISHAPFSLVYHFLYEIKGDPCITIVLFGDGGLEALKNCISSVENNAGYSNYQYLILTSRGQKKNFDKVLQDICGNHQYHIILTKWNENNKKINDFLVQYGKDYLLFLDMNTKVESADFLIELLMLAQQKDVGFVGPKILSGDGFINHAGIALAKSAERGVVYRFRGELAESHGYEAGLRHIRGVSAVSKECMMIEKKKFFEADGFSTKWKWYTGLDINLRVGQKSYENLWTPYAQLTEYTLEEKPQETETKKFINDWKELYSKEDPYYNRYIRYDLDNIHDNNTPMLLLKKGITYAQTEGISGLIKRMNIYSGKGGDHSSLHMTYSPLVARSYAYKDVLFINGCAPTVPHPPRYRVTHQREQLEACSFSTDEVYYEHLDPSVVKYYRTFVFFRCPYTENVGKLIQLAKKINRLVLFDIDDLVVDTKYTDKIPYVMSLNPEEKCLYDDGVIRMGKTLKLCDAAITTTERLAEELSNYVPQVFINRNVASERMYELSQKAIFERDVLPYMHEDELPKSISTKRYQKAKIKAKKRKNEMHIGYFSGSITHNDDFDMIKPALLKILDEFVDVKLHLVGELDLPKEMQPYEKQIIIEPFTAWERLPQLISSVDINLAPITKSIFNEAKSENKWTEAALVKVPTIASNVGAFGTVITDRHTGILCDDTDDWYSALKMLIENPLIGKEIAQNAYEFVKENYITIYTGRKLAEYIRKTRKENIAFALPSLNCSGGILVALKHMSILKSAGYDVFIINDGRKEDPLSFGTQEFPVVSKSNTIFSGTVDKSVATMWNTFFTIEANSKFLQRYYLVQGYETDFYEPNNILRVYVEQTYSSNININYLTISKWCEKWLKEKYGKNAMYIPNGIDQEMFYPREREFNKKIRILIEGDNSVHYKNVDESFRIVEKLDHEKYEIWYLSYKGKPKKWYHVDKFLNHIPHEEVAGICRQCHILLKSSMLESFSYPPLEMMATGGFVVAAPNGGNTEFLRNEKNCLLYPLGDTDAAVAAIEKICNDGQLRATLYEGGLETAAERNWDNIKMRILEVYK